MRKLPKRIVMPANGMTVEEEPDDQKAARLLAMFRHMVKRNRWTEGITIGDAQFMVIRYRPEPHGPHNPDADLTGTEL